DWTVIILSDTLGKDFSSIEALREDVRGRVMDFLDRVGAGREVDVLIVPGIGQFAHGMFKGNAMDAYYYLLHELSQVLPPKEDLDVHFDSTHGLNYITLLAYRALKELLGIAAITNRVTFTAYNSDPFVPKITRELTINVIETGEIKPDPLHEPLPARPGEYLGNFSLKGKDYGTLLQSLKKLHEVRNQRGRINAWVSSIINGLPLVFTSAFPDVEMVSGAVGELLNEYTNSVEVSPGRVERRLSLGAGFGVLVKLSFQVRALEMEGLPNEEPSIGELLEISERIFRGRVLASTKTELDRLARSVRADTNGWIRYSKLLRLMGKSPNPQVDNRNFLVHAGLEANVTEVKREGEFYVRYTKEKVKYGGTMEEPGKVIEKILAKTFEE
ncbi:TIGR01897 family CRISPR-associated protein, partial [Thermococci archaeon]